MLLRSGTIKDTPRDAVLEEVSDGGIEQEECLLEEELPNFNIRYCKSPKCGICKHNMLDTDPTYFNHHHKEKYNINDNFTCKSKNVIYQISCKQCSFQYIGRTSGKLQIRAGQHRRSLISKNGSPLLIKHFTKTHSVSDLIIKPIRTVLGTIDEAKESELHWIKELGTLYPYGLNDRLDKPYIDAHKYYLKGSCVFSLFNRRKSRRGSRGKGSHHTDGTNTPQKVEIEEIYRSFLRAFVYDNEYRFFIRVKINGLPKAVVRQLIQYCILKSKKRNSNVCLLNTTILDICRNYWVKSVPKSYNEDDKKSDYFVCSFINKNINLIPLTKILNSKKNKDLYPSTDDTVMKLSFKYGQTIRNKLLNYTNIVKNYKGETLPCSCNDSIFKDPALGHIITGDLSFIKKP